MTSRIPETTTTDSRRLGAMTAVVAMLKLERCAEHHEGEDDTAEAYFTAKAAALRAITDAAGTLPPFLSGFIEAIAEVLHYHATNGAPDLLVWKPEAAMSKDEYAKYRKGISDIYKGAS